MATAMWTSKLGNKYPKDEIQRQDAATQRELKRLRGLKACGNHRCADCGAQDSSWASVSHGVFICVTCSDVHRSIGTHVSKVKGCTGTYLWGPDEIELMQTKGNSWADAMYGAEKVASSASKEEKQRFVLQKYRERAGVATARATASVQSSEASALTQTSEATSLLRPEPQPQALSSVVHQPQAAQPQARHSAPLARGTEIADAIFEDLFGELERQEQPLAQAPVPSAPLPSTKADDLAAFLESALSDLSRTLTPPVAQPCVQEPLALMLRGIVGR